MSDKIIYFDGSNFSDVPGWDGKNHMASSSVAEEIAPMMDYLQDMGRKIWTKSVTLSAMADRIDPLLSDAGLSSVDFYITPEDREDFLFYIGDMGTDTDGDEYHESCLSLYGEDSDFFYSVTVHNTARCVDREQAQIGVFISIARSLKENGRTWKWSFTNNEWQETDYDQMFHDMLEQSGLDGMTEHQAHCYMDHMDDSIGELIRLIYSLYDEISDGDFDKLIDDNEWLLRFYNVVADYADLTVSPFFQDEELMPEPGQLQFAVVSAQDNVTGTAMMYRNGNFILSQFVEPVDGLYVDPGYCRETAGIPIKSFDEAVTIFKETAGMSSKFPVIRIPLSSTAYAVFEAWNFPDTMYSYYTCGKERDLNEMEKENLDMFISSFLPDESPVLS